MGRFTRQHVRWDIILMPSLRPTDGFYTSMPRLEARQRAPREELLERQHHRATVSSWMAHWDLSPCRSRTAAAQDFTATISWVRQARNPIIAGVEDSEAVEVATAVRNAIPPMTT